MAETTPTSMELITAAFSAMLGADVVPLEKVPESLMVCAAANLKKVSVHDLFRATHYIGDMHSGMSLESLEVPGQEFEINVRTVTGTRIVVPVTQDHTIAQIKAAVEAKTGIPTINQRLLFNSSTLHNHGTVSDFGMFAYCNLIMIDGEDVTKTKFGLDPSDLAPEYDYDFTDKRDDGQTYKRGWNDVDRKYFVYTRPYGWKRFALKVQGKYENDTWLGPNGIRTDSEAGEWPVSYHGTGAEACGNIHDTGYDPKRSSRQLYGPGIYCSPDIESVANYKYAQTFECKGKKYKVVLQNRVNPEKIAKQHKKKSDSYRDYSLVLIDKEITPFEYWRCPRHDPEKGIYDIRPYGILIRKA